MGYYSGTMSSPPKKTRRSSADIRELLLEAARDLFRSEGYEATTTRQIAERAGVSEPLLFSNFGSKAGLFEAAVLTPIADFVTDYAASFSDHDADHPQTPAATAAVLGMVLGVALLDDLVFPSGSRRPSRDRLIAEMEKLTLHGITDRPQTQRPAAPHEP